MTMEIHTLCCSDLGNSSHVLIDRDSYSGVVIDLMCETDRNLNIARSVDVSITWALDTLANRDFVFGRRELVAENLTRPGARSGTRLLFAINSCDDVDAIGIGSWRLRMLVIPGHVPEHPACLPLDEAGYVEALFSGGSLIVGTRARTDFFGLALSWLFARDSRQYVLVSSIAAPYPAYYCIMRSSNPAVALQIGPTPSSMASMDLEDLDLWIAQGALFVDLRSSLDFRSGHLSGRISGAVEGKVSGWIGWLVSPEGALVLVTDEPEGGNGQIDEAQRKVLRIDYERIVVYLKGALTNWVQAALSLVPYDTATVAELAKYFDFDQATAIIEIREAGQWYAWSVPGTFTLVVDDILTTTFEFPNSAGLVSHCGHGYRATLGAGLHEGSGYRALIVLDNSFNDWEVLGIDEK